MMRPKTLLWGSIVLVVLFAFFVMPAHEYFKDAYGRETDVSPDAPPTPDWLIPLDERTGKRRGE
jgi:hypothetical protein